MLVDAYSNWLEIMFDLDFWSDFYREGVNAIL